MRLIDADRLLEERRLHLYYHLPNGDTAIPIIDIKHAPTVNNPDLIRCKDCKSNSGCGAGIYSEMVICYNTGAIHSPDWYCADGKPKDVYGE